MPGPIGILEKLSPDQQQLVWSWLQLHSMREVVQKLQAEPPKGLGMRVHLSSLQAFKRRMLLQRGEQLAEFASELGVTGPSLDLFLKGTSSTLAQQMLELASSPDPRDIGKAFQLYSAFERASERKEAALRADRKAAIAEQRLALQKLKVKLDAEVRLSLPPNLPAEKRFAAFRASFAQELSAIDAPAPAATPNPGGQPLTTDH